MARLTERAGLVALAAFLVVDVALVGLAVSSTRQPVARGGQTVGTPSGALSTAPAPGPSTSPAGSAAPTGANGGAAAAVDVVPVAVGVVGVDAKRALRFTQGSCDKGGATLELTTDGGRTWGPRSAPFDVLVRVRVRADGSAFAVGADKGGCAPAIKQTRAVDAQFGGVGSVSDAWYRDPRATDTVGLPSGKRGKPCGSADVIDLAVVDSGAQVLCGDGTLLSSRTGSSWRTVTTARGALAVAIDGSGRSYLVVPSVDGCKGLAVVDSGSPTKAAGCVVTDLGKVDPGSIALSVTPDRAWLRVGDEVHTSAADLTGWTTP
ncbi:hypothetical protein ACFUC1_07410 [Pedococcus sp. NPDC057267]|uniref:hypothetical protein n=1 Tax=Pedococcus sp. NPDC057267 TaxID=3346077 RepID=UPI003634E3C2